MSSNNRLHRMARALRHLPGPARRRAYSALMGNMVPFVGTAHLDIQELSPERVVVRVPNRRRNRNHIGQVHAAAMALVAETATGFVAALNVPDSKLLLVKTLKVSFRKRTRGDLVAVATLSPEQIEAMRSVDKGDVTVEVHVTDQSGEEPISCEMVWAWIPRKRK